ncbi:L,D-transpeptidase [Frankia sp. AgB32]|nr:L,D-transpeptidase [Frankia sp. AgB32]
MAAGGVYGMGGAKETAGTGARRRESVEPGRTGRPAAAVALLAAGISLVLAVGPPLFRPGFGVGGGRGGAPPGAGPGGRGGAPPRTLIATLGRNVPHYLEPDGTAVGIVPGRWRDAVAALPVIDQRPGWLRVRLAQRPNGSTGWVRRSDVGLTTSPYRIEIDARSARLRLFDDDAKVMDVPAGVGTLEHPTPTGNYFVALLAPSPGPGYGDVVLVTSAHSPTTTDYDATLDASVAILGPLGADAQIGVDDQAGVEGPRRQAGARVSRGCVRLHLADLGRLRAVPAGTPVDIIAEAAV